MSHPIIEQIFTSMIDYFRIEEAKLNNYEKEHITPSLSLSKPCQIYVISSFDHNNHMIIKTHFFNFNDKQIHFIQLYQNNFPTQLKNLIENFKQNIDIQQYQPSCNPYRSLADSIIQFGRKINHSINNQLTTLHNNSKQEIILDQIRIWEFSNKIEKWDYKNEVDRLIHDIRRKAALDKKRIIDHQTKPKEDQMTEEHHAVNTLESDSEHLSGFLTCFYPPILIGELTSAIEDQILQKYGELTNVVYSTKIDNVMIVALKGGLLGVQTSNFELAKKILNAIMGATLTLGIPDYLLHKSEIAGIYFEKDTSKIHVNYIMHASSRMDLITSSLLSGERHKEHGRMQISLSDLKLVIKYSEKIYNNQETQKLSDLLLTGFTLLENDNHAQSFLTFWIIIEIHLHSVWADKLKKAKIANNIQKDLDRWPSSKILKILYVDKLVNTENYHIFKTLLCLRNKIIHQGHGITKEEANQCYKTARMIVRYKIEVVDSVHYTVIDY